MTGIWKDGTRRRNGNGNGNGNDGNIGSDGFLTE